MTPRILATMTAVVTLAVMGCSNQAPTADQAAASEPAGPPVAASHGLTQGERPQLVSGTVLEAMDAAGYTYVRLETAEGELWAASNQFEVAAGDRVVLPLETPMRDFHSDSLDRDFELIYFASFIVPEGEAPELPAAAGERELPPGHPPLDAFAMASGAGAPPAMGAPSGGITLAELWQRTAELAGTRVTVQGRVVKYNEAILGRNWFHLQDGSGELEKGTNDITVTGTDTVSVGDVIVATGTVAIDRDFGAGYTYTVRLEDAEIIRR